MKCAKCGSERVTAINPEQTIYECNVCRARMHINGLEVTDMLASLNPGSAVPGELKKLFD